jgi:hypothetical protein
MGVDDRVRGALLAGAAVAALTVGGWWWRDSTPALGPVEATPAPSAGAFLEPGVRLDPRPGLRPTDPQLGEVVTGPDPEGPVVIHQEPGRPAATLISHTVWADRSPLRPGAGPVVRQFTPSAGERYLLTVGCTGPGEVVVTWSGAGSDASAVQTSCDPGQVVQELTAAGGPLLVRFTVEGDAADLDARLVALF